MKKNNGKRKKKMTVWEGVNRMNKCYGNEMPIANVKIVSEGATASVYLDGRKIKGLVGYEIVHDRIKSQMPIIRLNIQSQLDIETGMVPELPEPYTYFYSPIGSVH